MINGSPDILNYNYIPAYLTDGEACAIRAYIDLKNALDNDDVELHLGESDPNQPTYLTFTITSTDSPKERLSKTPFAKNTWSQLKESMLSKTNDD